MLKIKVRQSREGATEGWRRFSATVQVDIYNTDVLICVGGTSHEMAQELCRSLGIEPDESIRDMKGQDESTLLGHTIFPPNSKATGIWFKKVDPTSELAGTVAHECLHATNHILARSGIFAAPDHDNRAVEDEAHAYLLGFLVKMVTEVFQEVHWQEKFKFRKRKKKPVRKTHGTAIDIELNPKKRRPFKAQAVEFPS